jgi:ABC-type transport system involved in multi-copper enzyme maturation permease subunit
MTILPIVERELRVAARKKNMGRVRWATTIVCVLAAVMSLGLSGSRGGAPLFSFLTAYAFWFALGTGMFVTADCLSEEKRNGTLGFLFLTDLNGYDVVLGKFVARALGPFYAMGAIVPVTAVSLAMGGVTGGEFWRVAVVLLNTLFLSLTMGICVSAWSTESQRAVAGTLAFLLALLATHGVAMLAGVARSLAGLEVLGWLSPSFTFQSAYEANYAARPAVFWCSLVMMHGLGWLLLGLASVKIQSAWQDKPPRARERTIEARAPRRSGKVPGDQPLPWLLRSSAWLNFVCWGVAVLWAVGAVTAIGLSAFDGRDPYWKITFAASKVVAFVLKTAFVMVACRFFTEARRSGLLEILLCVPLTDWEIIRAQWRSLWRLFAGPLVLFCVPLCLRTLLGWDVVDSQPEMAMTSVLTGFGSGALLALNTVTDFIALGWVGMWFAASMKFPALAPGLTMLLVLVLPSVLFCVPAFLVNVLFVAWARARLARGFRGIISEQYSGAPVVA